MSKRLRRASTDATITQLQPPSMSSCMDLAIASKLFRKSRATISLLSLSPSTSQQSSSFQRPVRQRRLNAGKNPNVSNSTSQQQLGGLNVKLTSSQQSTAAKSKSGKEQTPPLTPIQIMVRKLYDRINRGHKARQRDNINQLWANNRENLDSLMRQQNQSQTIKALSISGPVVTSEDILEATLTINTSKSTTTEKVKVVVVPEATDELRALGIAQDGTDYQRIPVTTLEHMSQIPPVLDWTAIPHNLHEDDGKFLTNIPFLGDDFIDKDAKFIDEMVTLYEGKVHEAKDSSSFKKMNDEVLYTLVQTLMKIEVEEGPHIFKDIGKEYLEKVDNQSAENVIQEDVKPACDSGDLQKKTSFSAVAAKLFQSENSTNETESSPLKTCESEGQSPPELIQIKEPQVESKVEEMEMDLIDNDSRSQTASLFESECGSAVTVSSFKPGRPSNAVFTLLATTFKGLGTESEIRERYEAAEKAMNTPMLQILPNGMENHKAESYSIPNIEGPFAKYLPKDATMHAYQILFCRRCFTYDCKRHTGDDQVDVKYYKNRQMPASSSSSVAAAATNFSFLCKNPDCWQMNDTKERSAEEILAEWSPGDRSLFLCFIESFPSNYCFIAYLMRNKKCLQVKEYANLENVPKMESCPRVSSRKPKHRKQRLGFNKKPCGSNNKRNVTRRWINNVKKTEKSKEVEGGIKSAGGKLPPRFMPCVHENGGECDSSCTCRINKTSCEKFCTCGLTCPYRFPGCRCTSTCDSKRCICFAAARECDPDLCLGCGANEDNVEKISCLNVNIQRKLHKHLLMGRSDVSGWGIYIKNDAQKGEFIAEYRGELISHDESERRGHVYDKIQHTFLFELNDHFVVDATRKGNKARFVNSSKNPNCEVKRMLVNGDHRIGIYAKRYIEAGEELFYDYEDVLEKQQKTAEGGKRLRDE